MRLIMRFAHEIQYRVFLGMILFIRFMPYAMVIAIGKFLGFLTWIASPLHRKIAHLQIREALKSGNSKSLNLRVFMNQGISIVDTIKCAYMNEREIKEMIIIEGREHIESAIASKRGIMMITGHMNIEILGHIPRLLGFTFSIMGDVMKNPRFQSIIEDMRSRCGFTLLPPKGGMVNLLTNELKNGHTIGIVIDQRGKRDDKVFCDFFGLPAPTNPAPALIALRGDALIQPVSAIKQGNTYRFRFEKPIDTRSFGSDFIDIHSLRDCWKSKAITDLSSTMHAWLESVIRDCPDQWFWLHCRWARRSDMKKIVRSRKNFKEFIDNQAQFILSHSST